MSPLPPQKVRVAVLISGRGSNMRALAEAAKTHNYPAEISLVISNRPQAAGLKVARTLGIETLAIDHKDYPSRESFEGDLNEALREAGIELICCAGFMRVLTPFFTRLWPDQILNIHPSLLPKYKGLHTHQRAIEAKDERHGASVHFVVPELDAGTVIIQGSTSLLKGDTVETLQNRIHTIEHQIYPTAIKYLAEDGLTLKDDALLYKGERLNKPFEASYE